MEPVDLHRRQVPPSPLAADCWPAVRRGRHFRPRVDNPGKNGGVLRRFPVRIASCNHLRQSGQNLARIELLPERRWHNTLCETELHQDSKHHNSIPRRDRMASCGIGDYNWKTVWNRGQTTKEAESDLIRRSPMRHNRISSGGRVRRVLRSVRSVIG